MKTAKTISLDPFGFAPSTASAITGLGGPRPGAFDAVFHTDYCRVLPGRTQFRLRFDGLRAKSGTLRIIVGELSLQTSRARRKRHIFIPLAKLAGRSSPITIRFRAKRSASYALRGQLIGDSDAVADGLEISLDRAGDGLSLPERLARSRRPVFERGSQVEKRLWRRSPVDAAGLVVDRTATLAEPISQMCTAAQFAEPQFERWTKAIGTAPTYHRKTWEFAYILSVLDAAGALRPGARGLGFGVGSEPLPSLFAAMDIAITGTDLHADSDVASQWAASGQHSNDVARLYRAALCDRAVFDRNVSFRAVDMNDIPDDLEGFDFCWSACAFEHLGTIDAGLRFFRESMRCLRPGGIAVHTTELNLTSDDRTLKEGVTVLFRRRDMETLALRLHRDGHEVWPITYDQGSEPPDRHVDIPPYLGDEHLKIALASYVTTSFGLAARRGPAPA